MTENPAQPVSTVKTALQETASANLLNFTPECREQAGLGSMAGQPPNLY